MRLREARVAAFLGDEEAESHDELEALIGKTARLFAQSITEGTRKDYQRRWRKWVEWCVAMGFEPLDSPPEVVMLFLTDYIGRGGAALGTLRSYMAAINRVHVEAGLMPPGDDPAMTMFLRTMSKTVEPSDPQGEISPLKIGPLRAGLPIPGRARTRPGGDPRPRSLRPASRGVGDGEILDFVGRMCG